MRLPFPSASLMVAALALLLALAAVTTSRADTIVARSAELRLEEDWYVLDADFELILNPTLEEAVGRGVPLYFAVEFELQRPRWYWLDETVTQDYRTAGGAQVLVLIPDKLPALIQRFYGQ